MISGFCHKVDENCTPLGYYAVCSGNSLTLIYHYTLRNSQKNTFLFFSDHIADILLKLHHFFF